MKTIYIRMIAIVIIFGAYVYYKESSIGGMFVGAAIIGFSVANICSYIFKEAMYFGGGITSYDPDNVELKFVRFFVFLAFIGLVSVIFIIE